MILWYIKNCPGPLALNFVKNQFAKEKIKKNPKLEPVSKQK
jgi:hypothetical protein